MNKITTIGILRGRRRRFGASVLWLFRWTEPEHWSANFFPTVASA